MNPTPKPTDTRYRVLRGGGRYCLAMWVRAAYRGRSVPADRSGDIGFRCALRGREPRV